MIYDWIDPMLAIGGVVTVSKINGRVIATLNRKGKDPLSGEPCGTLPEAMTSLNTEIREEVADEMVASGLV